ncbi:hypothetical protein T265_00528 [Opisthorchis viverrini]|uniref:Uncharacterized protein n=1 Tax=Opisthorchis viverrini TaxID=6198 RepID=A0A075A1P5_OPIVI|nr:hypothetical protein T265_00528 [Opisthorchis viverrini]KER33638.1 hypothetical protein T265_00528 [Opisthorchis viverrini]
MKRNANSLKHQMGNELYSSEVVFFDVDAPTTKGNKQFVPGIADLVPLTKQQEHLDHFYRDIFLKRGLNV